MSTDAELTTLQRVSVSMPFSDAVDPEELVPLFHEWIRAKPVDGTLIDVARYAHVHHGPGVMLVGHEGDYSVDMAGGVAALRYTLKRDNDGAPAVLVGRALDRLLQAVDAVRASGRTVDTGDVTVRIFDRLRAPNTEERRAALGATVGAAVGGALGAPVAEPEALSDDAREPLAFRVRALAAA